MRHFPGMFQLTFSALIIGGTLSLAPEGVIGQETAPVQEQIEQDAQDTLELQKRVRELEQQLVDLRAMIGALESLARSGGGAPPRMDTGQFGESQNGSDPAVTDMQIQAMTRQMEQLMNRVDQLERSGNRPQRKSSLDSPLARDRAERSFLPDGQSGLNRQPLPRIALPQENEGNPLGVEPDNGFNTQILPHRQGNLPPTGRNNRIGGFDGDRSQQPSVEPRVASFQSGSAKDLYQNAYGHMLRRDYRSAEAAFKSFLTRHSDDQLAGNAQYWLGQTYFARRKYKRAASAFLIGYKKYAKGTKASDSLMKLAVSLSNACASVPADA